jgi:hypothetical protein
MARVVLGLALIAVPLSIWGMRWWDLVGAAALPVLAAAVAHVVARVLPRCAEGVGPGWTAAQRLGTWTVLVVVVGVGTAVTFLSPVSGTALYLFFGISMVIAGLRGEEGCEVLAVPNLVLGSRGRIWCPLFSPIDLREQRRQAAFAPRFERRGGSGAPG